MRNRALIADLISAAKLSAIYPFFELVEAGGLMAHAFDLAELNKQAAKDIDAILPVVAANRKRLARCAPDASDPEPTRLRGARYAGRNPDVVF